MSKADYSLLGPLTVRLRAGGEPLAPKAKVAGVLGRLLLEPRKSVSSWTLIDEIWRDERDTLRDPVATVQSTVRHLRRLLHDDDHRIVVTDGGREYRLEAPPLAIDAERFRLLVQRGREVVQRRPHAAIAMLEEALGSWRGPLLGADADEIWAAPFAVELDGLRDLAEVTLNEARLAARSVEGLDAVIRRQLIDHPDDERRHGQLIRALRAEDRRAEAAVAYRAALDVLESTSPGFRALGEGTTGDAAAWVTAHRDAGEEPVAQPVILHANVRGGGRAGGPGLGTATLVIEQAGGAARPLGGERVVAVFRDADEAVRAAAALVDDDRLDCSVGVHAGVTIQTGDRLSGPAPARCRQLADAAHPRQALITEVVRLRLQEVPELRPFGAQRFIDLLEPTAVFALAGPEGAVGSQEDVRLPKTLNRHPNNLPIQPTRFVGRSKDLAALSGLIAGGQLITLVGTGGAGKTRLALQLAAGCVASFADGAWFAGLGDLAAGADTETVAVTVVNRIGILPLPDETAVDTLLRHVSDRALILVIDNCEHVLPAAAELAARVRTASSGTCLVATSVRPLGLDGEQIREVQPLASAIGATADELPDAVQLLLERVGAPPDDALSALHWPDEAAELCALLDGLPLAIELAAGQVARRGVRGLAVEVREMLAGERSLAFFKSHDPSRPPRQRTIEAAIAWSYELLSPLERRVLRRLAVFRGTFGLTEVKRVVADEEISPAAVEEAVDSLVNCSMVVALKPVGGTARLRLRPPIANFALARLADDGDADGVRGRHVETYLELARATAPRLFGPAEQASLEQLEADHDNLRVVLKHLVAERRASDALILVGAMWWLWFSRGHFEQGEDAVREVLALDPTPSRERVRALRAASHLSWWRGAYERTKKDNIELERCANAAGDPWGLAWAPMGHGAVLLFPAPEEALPLFELSRQRFADLECDWEAGYALQLIGGAHWFAGDVAAAGAAYEEAVGIFAEIEHGSVLASVRRGAGLMAALGGEPVRGAALCHEGLEFSERIGDRAGAAQALNFLALIARHTGALAIAAERHAAALTYAREVGELWAICSALDGIAGVAAAVPEERLLAVQLLACSAAIGRAAGYRPALHEQQLRAADEASLRARLAPEKFAAAVSDGSHMSVTEAVASALAFELRNREHDDHAPV